jgi:dolichyl-phosphate-mannose--protein O-mannosyl transferase
MLFLMCTDICPQFFFGATHAQGILRNLIFGTLLLGLAFAIFRQYRWALRLAAVICLFVVVFLPIGLFNPFTAGDYMAAGNEPPSVVQTLLWLIPL